MYSPVINYREKKNIYNLISNDNSKRKLIRDNLNNSAGIKKLVLSRNIDNKNFLLKTKYNNSYKKVIFNRQLSSDNSPTDTNIRQNNTTTNINLTNGKNTNKKGQILIFKKKGNNDFNNKTLYKYLIANDSHHLYNNKNNYSNNNKLDFTMNKLINNNQKNENSAFLYKNDDKIKSNNKNNFRKILNYPLSPISKGIKIIKLSNLYINDYSSSLTSIKKYIIKIIKKKLRKYYLGKKKFQIKIHLIN